MSLNLQIKPPSICVIIQKFKNKLIILKKHKIHITTLHQHNIKEKKFLIEQKYAKCLVKTYNFKLNMKVERLNQNIYKAWLLFYKLFYVKCSSVTVILIQVCEKKTK